MPWYSMSYFWTHPNIGIFHFWTHPNLLIFLWSFMNFYGYIVIYIYISVKSAHGYFMVACCIPSSISINDIPSNHPRLTGFDRVNRSQGGHRLDAVRISAALACQPAPSHDDTLEAGFTMQTRKIISKKSARNWYVHHVLCLAIYEFVALCQKMRWRHVKVICGLEMSWVKISRNVLSTNI